MRPLFHVLPALLSAATLALGCASQKVDPPGQSALGSASSAPLVASSSGEPAASASAAPAPPPPPVDPAEIARKAGASCQASTTLTFFGAPLDPRPGQPLRALLFGAGLASPADGLVVIDPEGHAANAAVELRTGPPASLFAAVPSARAGTYRFLAHQAGEVVGCNELKVSENPPRRGGGPQGIAWENRVKWDRRMEDLYSAWIEKLFDAPIEDSFSVTALHEITKDPNRNLLHGYLGLDEDDPPPRGIRLDPDCADLPYFLRAYFSFKLGLPFSFSACSRGSKGQAPRCGDPSSNLEQLETPVPSRVRRFEGFLRKTLKDTVHSGTGRTLAKDDKTDYYPIRLSAETLRPGAIFADPYGHILVVSKRVPQTADAAGILFAVDGQPDGTVSRKRFWRGNFLFSLDDASMGSPGFKRFRPTVSRRGGVVTLSNDSIVKSADYGDYGLEQSEGDASAFYDRMDDVLSPLPLDPERALLGTIVALEEQLKARVISVENGEKHFRAGGGAIDMPNGASIFETQGDWENFSTPSRDLRILIAIDVVRAFPALVARRPERFKMPAGKSKDDVVKGLEALLARETAQRKVEYVRSDESKFSLSLADVLLRTAALEMAYNPNDCPEARWGASKGTPEMAPCRRAASADQRRKMERVKDWFHERKRPSRGS